MTTPSEAFEALMPEPFATLHDDGYWTMKPGREPHESRYAGWRQEVYTADQMREAIRGATERAAKVCDQKAIHAPSSKSTTPRRSVPLPSGG